MMYTHGSDDLSPEHSVEPRRPWWEVLLGWLGIGGHLAVVFLYAASGLVAPLSGIVVLWLAWAALLLLAIRLLRHQPVYTPLVPLAALGVLFGGLALGESLLGWAP